MADGDISTQAEAQNLAGVGVADDFDLAAEVTNHADKVLKASGSALKHYTMASAKRAILSAMMDAMEAAYRAGAKFAERLYEDRFTRLTEEVAAQAREIEAWAALAHKAFHAADVVLAPICADVGKEILHPENCPDLVSVMFADGVQIPAQHYADLYWATHPDLIHALTGGQP